MLVAALLATAPVHAGGLFTAPSTSVHIKSSLTGVQNVRLLNVDRTALANLRAADEATLEDFPVGNQGDVTVDVRRFEPFPAHARVEVVGPQGSHDIALPDRVYFEGHIRNQPTSRVLLIAGTEQVQGFVARDGDVFPFGPDTHGRHRAYALTGADVGQYPPPQDFCANDLEPEAVAHPAPSPMHAAPAQTPSTAEAGAGSMRVAELAIETDTELRAKFSSDSAALDYLTALLAASTAIYERDVNVRLQYSYIRLWAPGSSDPWTATTTGAALNEVLGYWNEPSNNMATIAGRHDLVHFLSGKTVRGGIAYVNVLCDQSYGFGVSQVYGSFDISNPSAIWDLVVFTHELGHNFGSPHSHCYNPPLDKCYGSESGCYSGATVTSHGSLMSYCHLLSGGLSNIDLSFGDTISQRIRDTVANASCLASVTASTTSTTSTTTTTTRPTTTTTTTTTTRATTTTTRATTTSTTVTTTTTSTTLGGGNPTTSATASSTTTTSTITSTTTRPPATTTTTSTTTSTRVSTSTTTVTTTSTTVSTVDDDGDGVVDVQDACPTSEAGEMVDATGCAVCPCDGGATPWRSHTQYLRCIRSAMAARSLSTENPLGRANIKRAQQSTCGRRAVTRCCVTGGTDQPSTCRVLRSDACEVRRANDTARNLGAGSCLPSPCSDDEE